MDLKEIYTKLEAMDGGSDIVAAVKSEIEKLNAEAKTHREKQLLPKRSWRALPADMMLYWQPLGSKTKKMLQMPQKNLKALWMPLVHQGKSLTRSQKNYPVLPSDCPKSTKSWLTPKPPKRPRPQNV